MKIQRQIGGDDGHVEEVDEAEPEFRAFDEVRRDAAEISDEDDDHECGRLAIHTLGAVGAHDRENIRRPKVASRSEVASVLNCK